MKYLLIYNPTSRSGKSKKDFERILSGFNNRTANFDYVLTSKKDDAIELAKNARGFDSVVALGGDGTICEVITGLMHQPETIRPKFGVVHIGTSPDFNRYHNLPVDIDGALDILLNGKTRKIDIGKISHLGLNKERPMISYFGSSVNIGLGPEIASKSNGRYRKYLGDFLGTLASTLVSLSRFKSMELNLMVDDKPLELRKVFNLTIGKDPYLASGMRIPIEMQPMDERLYVLSIKGKSKISVLSNLWRLYCGNILDYGEASLKYCKSAEVSSKNLKIEFDGDFRGYTPARIEVLPKALELIVK
jgi:YegS/Rv2252/BmrU family lipid kinase